MRVLANFQVPIQTQFFRGDSVTGREGVASQPVPLYAPFDQEPGR